MFWKNKKLLIIKKESSWCHYPLFNIMPERDMKMKTIGQKLYYYKTKLVYYSVIMYYNIWNNVHLWLLWSAPKWYNILPPLSKFLDEMCKCREVVIVIKNCFHLLNTLIPHVFVKECRRQLNNPPCVETRSGQIIHIF